MEVQRAAARWLGAELDAQASARGFVMSERADLLAAYEEADARAKRMPAELRALVADNPRQRLNVDDGARSASQSQAIVGELIVLVHQGRRDEAIARLSSGAPFETTEFRAAIERINLEEERLLSERLSAQNRLERLAMLGLLVFTGLAGILAFAAVRARREAAQAEEEAEVTRHTLLEGAPDAIVIVGADGRITYVNPQAHELFGYDRSEMVGQLVEMLLPERHRAMGAPGLDLRGRRKDGSDFPADIRLAPLKIGGASFTMTAVRDATERTRVEAERAALLEAAPDAIVVAGADGRILFANARAEALFGYERTEMLEQPVEMLLPERYRATHPEHRSGYFGQPRVRPMGTPGLDLRARRKDGSEFPVEISLAPVTMGGTTFAMTAVRDASMRVQAEADRMARRDAELAAENAQQALRTQDTFVAVLGHDLRNPLGTIKMTLALVHQRGLRAESAPKIDRALRAADRMERMIAQILDFARARLGGGIPIERREIHLADVVAHVVGEAQTRHPDRTIEVEVAGNTAGCWDHDRLAQVVSNLVDNALTHGTAGAPVRVTVRGNGDDVAIRVSNAGEVPEDLRGELFNPFRRGRTPLAGAAAGLGLGLFITKQLVVKHGGTVDLEVRDGQTTFRVTLPRRFETCQQAS
jgi:protein-histidine pros-kinase